MNVMPALRHRDVQAVVKEFYRRHRDEQRMPESDARDQAIQITVAAFRFMDEAAESYGQSVPAPVTEPEVRKALAL